MLESKLKRRYTWPVELLGVIVEDGEVIIGTEEQIFPNGQINTDFINHQHQQNRHHLHNNCSVYPSTATTSGNNNNHLNGQSQVIINHSQIESSTNNNLYSPCWDDTIAENNCCEEAKLSKHSNDTTDLCRASKVCVNDKKQSESQHQQPIFSPRLINIRGSQNRKQVDHSFCTCNKRGGNDSSNKHDLLARISGVCGNTPDFKNGSGSSTTWKNAPNFDSSKHDNFNNGDKYHFTNVDIPDDEHSSSSCNEILQVQVSSLYPVSEEDVFTCSSSTIDQEVKIVDNKDNGTFQPIQGKFNFLRKKSRDSRKRKQEQQQQQNISSSLATAAASVVSTSTTSINNGHKDYCPHSKVFQVKSISPPGRSSDSSSVVISKGDLSGRDNYSSSMSGASSSNNNTPSHHSQLSSNQTSQSLSQCPHSDLSFSKTDSNCHNPVGKTRRESGVIGGEHNAGTRANGMITCGNGAGVLGSGGNLNCKALHPETEGKIPSANGTATGAMALQVNTANGDVKKVITLWQNYYPEGQWGWIVVLCALVVQAINHGFQLSFSTFAKSVEQKFSVNDPALLGLLGSISAATSLFFSPLWVALCKQKSTRLAGVFGGLIASLGCLFTSFATQFHQLFISYGAFVGVGVGLTRDASTLMVSQYFKRKRDVVEILVVSGSGIGILFMSVSIHSAIRSIGWRLGLQAVTGTILSTFFIGTCYRSASLYHPQRRAILHLKNQKKKVKDLKKEEKPPLIDYACLKSRTLQILLLSSAFTAFGINSPLFYLSQECRDEIDPGSITLLNVYLGTAWIIGCSLFGLIAVQRNNECRVSKQYLCQVASVICGISIMALITANGHNGLVIFVWVYGFSFGGYSYSLKVYTYERVRARHFARAWSFVQGSQAVPTLISIPLTGYLNENWGRSYGYSLSAFSVFIGSACLFLTDVRKRRLSRRKAEKSSMKTCETLESPKIRRLSFAFPIEQMSPQSKHDSGDGQGSQLDPALLSKELTCISEEGLADMDFQDVYFEDWDEFLGGDCITSCAKVENCLASEYDAEFALLLDRRVRRWSTARSSIGFPGHASTGMGAAAAAVASNVAGLGGQQHGILSGIVQSSIENIGEGYSPMQIDTLRLPGAGPREVPVFKNRRQITVIDEASV